MVWTQLIVLHQHVAKVNHPYLEQLVDHPNVYVLAFLEALQGTSFPCHQNVQQPLFPHLCHPKGHRTQFVGFPYH